MFIFIIYSCCSQLSAALGTMVGFSCEVTSVSSPIEVLMEAEDFYSLRRFLG